MFRLLNPKKIKRAFKDIICFFPFWVGGGQLETPLDSSIKNQPFEPALSRNDHQYMNIHNQESEIFIVDLYYQKKDKIDRIE